MDEIRTTQVSSPAKVLDIIPGDKPAIIIVKRAVNTKGIVRHFTFRPLVRDAALFQRLMTEVHKCDEILATVVTEWHEDGYATYLTDFSVIDSAASVSNPRALATAP